MNISEHFRQHFNRLSVRSETKLCHSTDLFSSYSLFQKGFSVREWPDSLVAASESPECLEQEGERKALPSIISSSFLSCRRRDQGGEWARAHSGSYRYAFGLVFLLFGLQRELYEELLQFFITIINTKLLKAANRNQRDNH